MLRLVRHLDLAELESGLAEIRRSPQDDGRLELIVRRPAVDEREVLDEATLDLADGLVGDCWRERGSKSTVDGSADPRAQLTLMNARVAALVSGGRDRWQLAGDQLYVDLDLGSHNVPPGTRLAIGSALVEVSDAPHTGCRKFLDRFGRDAHLFVNAKEHRGLNLRGVNATVLVAGVVRAGDSIRKAGVSRAV